MKVSEIAAALGISPSAANSLTIRKSLPRTRVADEALPSGYYVEVGVTRETLAAAIGDYRPNRPREAKSRGVPATGATANIGGKDLWAANDLVQMLATSKQTLRKWLADGKVKTVSFGKFAALITRKDALAFAAFLESRKKKPEPKIAVPKEMPEFGRMMTEAKLDAMAGAVYSLADMVSGLCSMLDARQLDASLGAIANRMRDLNDAYNGNARRIEEQIAALAVDVKRLSDALG